MCVVYLYPEIARHFNLQKKGKRQHWQFCHSVILTILIHTAGTRKLWESYREDVKKKTNVDIEGP